MIQLWRIILAGTRNFIRNAWLSTAATAVMTVTLTLILISYFLSSVLSFAVKTVVNKIDLSIYLNDSATEEQVSGMQERLQRLESVESVRYISKTEALAIFRRQHAHEPEILSSVSETDNPLPRSLAIKPRDPNKLAELTRFVEEPDNKPLISKFGYEGKRKDTVDKVIRVTNVLRIGGLVSSIMFIVISVLIIFNTIRMAIFTRRNEIEIMRLVGATNWFIRGPFIFEGALYGIIAAFSAAAMGYSLLAATSDRLTSFIGDVSPTLQYFQSYPAIITLGLLLVGVAIGTASSLMAMTRYLKL